MTCEEDKLIAVVLGEIPPAAIDAPGDCPDDTEASDALVPVVEA